MQKISVIGLGKLGASMAAAMASRGFDVIGVDVNPAAVISLNNGRAPVPETGLAEMIADNRARLSATLDMAEAVRQTDISFIIVPTPSDERGAFSVRYAATAFARIGEALAEKDAYHNVVLTSTVLPGSTRYALLPILERSSGKRAGADFGLCYSPEFIALGSVIRDFLNPDFLLIGEYDQLAGDHLAEFYGRLMDGNPPLSRMTLENAELTKIALNTYVTMKITFANMLADICELLPGGDVDVVTGALGQDSRIGAKYLRGALGFGGPCFPRDNVAFSFLARELKASAKLAEATQEMNRARAARLVERLEHYIRPGMRASVLGLAYKPETHVIEESPGIAVAKELVEAGCQVIVYDHQAIEEARRELGAGVEYAASLEGAVETAEIVVITTPDREFGAIEAVLPSKAEGGEHIIVDCWRIAAGLAARRDVQYHAIGLSSHAEQAHERLRQLWEPEAVAAPGPLSAAAMC